MGPTFLREVFGYGAYFGVYDWVVKKLTKN